AAFTTRTLDQSLQRVNRRAALNQWWTPQTLNNLAITTIGPNPQLLKSDGADIWVANGGNGTISRVRASDGRLLEAWTGATNAFGVLIATGKVFISGGTGPGRLFEIDPTQPPGAVTTLTSGLSGNGSLGIAFDGLNIWTTNTGNGMPNTGS